MRGWHEQGWRLSRALVADGHRLEHLLADSELELRARHGHAILLEHLGVRDVHDSAHVHGELNEELVERAAELGQGLAGALHRHADGVDEGLDGGLDVLRVLDRRVEALGDDLEHGADGLLLGGHLGAVVLFGGELVQRVLARDLKRLPLEREDELDDLLGREDDEGFLLVDVRDAGLLDDFVVRDLLGEFQHALCRNGDVVGDGVSRVSVACSGALRSERDVLRVGCRATGRASGGPVGLVWMRAGGASRAGVVRAARSFSARRATRRAQMPAVCMYFE